MHVRSISKDEKLLEFVFNKYGEDSDKTTKLFIGELGKHDLHVISSTLNLTILLFSFNY